MSKLNKKIWIGLLLLALLSPIGIILPKVMKAGKPWGEWTTEQVAKDKGFVPKGMQNDANLYKAPIQDYNLGKEEDSLWRRSVSYIVSGTVGLVSIAVLTFVFTKLYYKK